MLFCFIIERISKGTILIHHIGYNIFAEVTRRIFFICIFYQLLNQKICIKNINPHRCQSNILITGQVFWMLRLFSKFNNSIMLIHSHDTKLFGFFQRDFKTANRQISLILRMSGQHHTIIHFINMIPGQNQYIFRFMCSDNIQVLIQCICCTQIPILLNSLLCRKQFNKFIEFTTKVSPPLLYVSN